PAPFGMGGRGEQRLVEQVFPIAGELALRDQACFERVRQTAVADHEDIVVDAGCGYAAASERRRVELAERDDQTETGCEIVGERMAGNRRAAVGRKPDRFG